MKPLALKISIPALTINCVASAVEDIASGPAADCPELEALDHYAGTWVERVSGRPEVRRRDVGEWILEGRFLRLTWTSEAHEDLPQASGVTLMTYDREKSAYRSWAFLDAGAVIETEGVWDAAAHAMTWWHRTPNSGDTIITKASFSDALIQDWSIVKADEKGKVLRELAGRSVRQTG